MSPATVVPPEVEAYLTALREALDDLPTAERDDLLAEVEVSLVEAASEGESPIPGISWIRNAMTSGSTSARTSFERLGQMPYKTAATTIAT